MTTGEAFEQLKRIFVVLQVAGAKLVAQDLGEAGGVIRSRVRDLAKHRLLERMMDISEESYCAGWMCGLEENLWRIAHSDGPYHFGQGQFTREHMDELLALSNDAGGWWRWNDDPAVNDTEFVTLAEWEKIYKGESA